MENICSKDLFYSKLMMDSLLSFIYEQPLNASHLKPVEDILFKGKELTGFSEELYTYMEARKCVLDFDIFTMQENYKKFPNIIGLLMECYFQAADEGITEAYNNIGVFFGMVDEMEKAIPFFERAANAGHSTGMINLMGYYGMKKDYDKQFHYIEKLVSINNLVGMYNYALSYHFGYTGRQVDIEKAKSMYENIMALVKKEDKIEEDFSESMSFIIKERTRYNWARLRFMTEEHNKRNLKDILNLLTKNSKACVDKTKYKELEEEIMKAMN